MIVSHRHKFIFLKTRKSGGTSIELALRQICGDKDIITPITQDNDGISGRGPQNYSPPPTLVERFQLAIGKRRHTHLTSHATAARVRQKVGDQVWNTYFKIAVERDPWDRQVSSYFGKASRKAVPPFADFVRDAHIKNWPIYTIADTIVADEVIRYGPHLETALRRILDRIGVRLPPLSRAHDVGRPRPPLASLYDDETQEIIAKRHRREIDAFGWQSPHTIKES